VSGYKDHTHRSEKKKKKKKTSPPPTVRLRVKGMLGRGGEAKAQSESVCALCSGLQLEVVTHGSPSAEVN